MAVPARRLPTRRPSPSRRLVSVPRRRVAAPRPTRRRRRVPFLLFSLVMVATTVVGLVSAQALVAQDSFRIADLSAEAERLEASYGLLRLEVAELSAPDRIVAAARKAGLVLPEEVEILRLPAVTGQHRESAAETGPALALKGVPGGER
jgi:cell division protein FtsL